jgi:hypothetical protein
MRPREFDPSGYLIRTLARLGLAWNVKLPHPKLVERRRAAHDVAVER